MCDGCERHHQSDDDDMPAWLCALLPGLGWGVLCAVLYLVGGSIAEDTTHLDPANGGLPFATLAVPMVLLVAGGACTTSLRAALRDRRLRATLLPLAAGVLVTLLGGVLPLVVTGILPLPARDIARTLTDLSGLLSDLAIGAGLLYLTQRLVARDK